jgi:outer membrane receptor protein involved in Fe transport
MLFIASVFQNQDVEKASFTDHFVHGGIVATLTNEGCPMKKRVRENSNASANLRRRARGLGRVTTLTAAVLSALYGDHVFAATAAASNDEGALEEVVVTATRRSVSAQDLPISITAVSGSDLQQAGIASIAGLAQSMAGVNVTDKGPFGGVNGSTLIIRGLNSEATGGQIALATPIVPPVATYVDDTALFVNLRLMDIDHVEILRGPQGTLYGSGSLGGTIKFVQNAPDPSGFDARIETGLSKTQHTHALNEDVNGMLNLPLSDTFAVRLNASWTDEAGFINQPDLYVLNGSGEPVAKQPGNLFSAPETYSKDGTNAYGYRTARVAALWKPSDEFKAQLSYHYQISTADGFPWSSPLYGVDSLSSTDHTQATSNDRVDIWALTLDADLGFATLTSNSSYAHHDNRASTDLTNLYSNFSFYSQLYGANPRVLVTGHDELNDKPWSEEIRLASKSGGMFDWVGGLFFKNQTTDIDEHEFYPGYQDFYNACEPIYGQNSSFAPTSECGTGYTPGTPTVIAGIPIIKDQAYIGDFQTHFKDLAVFGELTWHITDDWSVTGGTRLFKQTLTQSQQTGLLFDGDPNLFGPILPIANLTLNDTWRRALWKINTSYKLDKDNLVYATWSQGFRRGSVNAVPLAEPAENYVTPPGLLKVSPDTADNYEIGVKGTLANRVRYSAAIYDIQWHNVQEGAQLTPLVLPGAINLGEAYSRGLETEVYANITKHISGQLSYTYDQTKVTEYSLLAQGAGNLSVDLPPLGGPLPGTPKNTLALGFEYGHVQIAEGELRYAINAHYQSRQVPAISATIPTVAGYTMVDTRLSYTMSHWTGSLYINNLTNNLGISSYSDPANFQQYYQAIVSQPRTYGFTVAYSFKGN